jgi:integrase
MKSGAKSWSFRFRRASGKQTRATIGPYPTIGLKAARKRADDMRKEVAAGGDPVATKRQARGGARSFGTLAERYLEEHARRHKRSHKADQRNLNKHVLPLWKDKLYSSIKRGDVIELVEGLVSAGKPTLANRVQSLISTVFSFAMDAELVEANPCHRLRKRGVERVGRRVLSDVEIRLFWNGIIEPTTARRTGLGLRLALLTGARVGEVAGLCRTELGYLDDPARAVWIIPAVRTKNGRTHLVPLPPLARSVVLELVDMIDADQGFLFPTRSRRRIGPMRSNSLTQAMDYFGKRLKEQVAPTWHAECPTPHDLRRTLETRLAELRISKEIRDRVLNHIPADVGSKHYNMYDYAAEKREALERWDGVVGSIIGSRATGRADRHGSHIEKRIESAGIG